MKKFYALTIFVLYFSICTIAMEDSSPYCDESVYRWRGASKIAPAIQDQSYIEIKNLAGIPFFARITVGGELEYDEATERWSRTQPGEIQFKDKINNGASIEVVRLKYQPLTLRFSADPEFTESYRAEFLTSEQLAGLRTLTALINDEDYLVFGRTYDFKGACCAICTAHVQENEDVQVLGCGHFFHVNCVEDWLATNFICPQCFKIPEVTKSYKAVDYCEC